MAQIPKLMARLQFGLQFNTVPRRPGQAGQYSHQAHRLALARPGVAEVKPAARLGSEIERLRIGIGDVFC